MSNVSYQASITWQSLLLQGGACLITWFFPPDAQRDAHLKGIGSYFSVFITMEVVFLLAFVIPQSSMTAVYRAIDTTIGGILALLIYLTRIFISINEVREFLVGGYGMVKVEK